MIKQGLDEAKIPYYFYETTGPRDSFVKANTFDVDEYSAVAAVGGDGTIFEVVNGILFREDGQKLPVVHIPNGSGNVYSMNHLITSVESAVEAIKKGHVIKQDLVKCILDFDSEQAVLEAGADPLQHIFYGTSGLGIGFVA